MPLAEPGGIDGFLNREVLPYAPDAWYEPNKVRVGYEISFNRYFYKPTAMRALEEIRADILAVERETDGLLREILGQPELPDVDSVRTTLETNLKRSVTGR